VKSVLCGFYFEADRKLSHSSLDTFFDGY